MYLYECRSRGSEKNSGLVHWVATLNISNIVKRETEKKKIPKKRKVENSEKLAKIVESRRS